MVFDSYVYSILRIRKACLNDPYNVNLLDSSIKKIKSIIDNNFFWLSDNINYYLEEINVFLVNNQYRYIDPDDSNINDHVVIADILDFSDGVISLLEYQNEFNR